MKKTLLTCIALLTTLICSQAQNFEGIIRWTVKAEITDPAKQKQLDEATKKMNSPENQAQMKALQEKMNSPEFKKQMEQNPQVKQMMEQAMAQMQSAGGLNASSLMPKSMTMKIKNMNSLIHMDGGAGAIMGEILYLKDKDQTYSIKREAKTYSVLPKQEDKKDNHLQYKVTKTNEHAKILNYDCVKHVVEIQREGQKAMVQNVWATPNFKEFDAKALARMQMGRNGEMTYLKDIQGTPLRIEMTMQGTNMTMEMSEIKKQSLDPSEFTVPADFQETKGFMGGGK
jgi:hypothetical protein